MKISSEFMSAVYNVVTGHEEGSFGPARTSAFIESLAAVEPARVAEAVLEVALNAPYCQEVWFDVEFRGKGSNESWRRALLKTSKDHAQKMANEWGPGFDCQVVKLTLVKQVVG